MENLQVFRDVHQAEVGFLWSPVGSTLIKNITPAEPLNSPTVVYGWYPYVVYDSSIYPLFLTKLVKLGIAFIWEYECTEDFYYYAYNFPTEENPNNYSYFKTGDRRKKIPHLFKKKLAEVESYSAAQELLYHLGIKNGSN